MLVNSDSQTKDRSQRTGKERKNAKRGLKMARPKKNKTNDLPVAAPPPVPPGVVDRVSELPYPLLRELQEISNNTGRTFDLTRPVHELEAICNKANNPPDSWRRRWE